MQLRTAIYPKADFRGVLRAKLVNDAQHPRDLTAVLKTIRN